MSTSSRFRAPRLVPLVLLLAAAPAALAQPAPAPAPVAASPAMQEGTVGEAPIAAGNVASARDRALDEAFRQLVERFYASLVGESAAPATPALTSLRATWLQRPKRLVRNYRVLEQGEQNGVLRVRVSAELDEAYMRREFERTRGNANRGVTPGIVPVVAAGVADAAAAVSAALAAEGVRTQQTPAPADDAGLRALAARSGRGVVVLVTGRAVSEGAVRGTGQHSVECQVSVRLVPATGDPPAPERAASGRAFNASESEARGSCFARTTREVLAAVLPDLGTVAASGADLRMVTLDLDLNEPAVLSPVLRALRKLAGNGAPEVRRVVVGRVEVRVTTRVSPSALVAGLTRELASIATVTRTGANTADSYRTGLQVRLLPPVLPASETQAPPPGAGAGAPAGAPARPGTVP